MAKRTRDEENLCDMLEGFNLNDNKKIDDEGDLCDLLEMTFKKIKKEQIYSNDEMKFMKNKEEFHQLLNCPNVDRLTELIIEDPEILIGHVYNMNSLLEFGLLEISMREPDANEFKEILELYLQIQQVLSEDEISLLTSFFFSFSDEPDTWFIRKNYLLCIRYKWKFVCKHLLDLYGIGKYYMEERKKLFGKLIRYVCKHGYHEIKNLENKLIENNFILNLIDDKVEIQLIEPYEDCKMESSEDINSGFSDSENYVIEPLEPFEPIESF